MTTAEFGLIFILFAVVFPVLVALFWAIMAGVAYLFMMLATWIVWRRNAGKPGGHKSHW